MKNIFKIIITIFILSNSIISNSQDIIGVSEDLTTTDYKQLGYDLYQGRMYFESIYFLEMAAKQRFNKSDYELIWKLAEACRQSREYIKAEGWYKKVSLTDKDTYPLSLFWLGEMQMTNQKYADAALSFDFFVNLYGSKYPAFTEKAKAKSMAATKAPSLKLKKQNYTTRPIIIDRNENPSTYGAYLLGDTLWCTTSVKIFKERSTNVKDVKGKYDHYFIDRLYKTTRDSNETWSQGFIVENLIYSMSSNYLPPVFSTNKKWMYATICDKKPKGTCQIYFAEYFPGGSVDLEEMPEAVNASKSSSKDPTLLNIGGKEIMIFSSNRDTSKGYDLFYSIMDAENGTEEAKPLSKLNTIGNEISPMYDMANKTLFFASDMHAGLGNFDIFKSVGDPLKSFDSIVNLGYPINSSYDEYYYYQKSDPYNFTGFVSSNRDPQTLCCDNIYEVQRLRSAYKLKINLFDKRTKKPIQNVSIKIFEVKRSKEIQNLNTNEKNTIDINLEQGRKYSFSANKARYDSIYIEMRPSLKDTIIKMYMNTSWFDLVGKVTDLESKTALEAKIFFIEKSSNQIIDSITANGHYRLTLPRDKEIIAEINKQQYMLFSTELKITPKEAMNDTVLRNLALSILKVGAKVSFSNIFFEFGKATLKAESYPALDRLVEFFNDNPGLSMEISGHTDNVGNRDFNLKLSENRAKSVVDYLTSKGVSTERMLYKGYAFDQPIAPNTTEEGRAKNRRVEFKVMKQVGM